MCKIWVDFSDGTQLTDYSDALTDTNVNTMCDNYESHEVLFSSNQRVLGFFATSLSQGGTSPKEGIKYLGVYYESCKDPCDNSQIQATSIADF